MVISRLLSKLRLTYTNPLEEREYKQLRLPLDKDCFTFFTLSVTTLFIPLSLRYQEKHLYPQIYIGYSCIGFGVLVLLLRNKLQNYMQLISIFFLSVALSVSTYSAHLIIKHIPPIEAFYSGCNLTLMKQMIDFRVIKFFPALILNVIFISLKFFMVQPKSPEQVALVIFLEIFPIVMSFRDEKADRSLFDSLYKSKNQLLKFRHLITENLPNPIAVVSSSYSKMHFFNDALMKLLKSQDALKVEESLGQLVLDNKENEENNSLLERLGYSSISEPVTLASLVESLSKKIEILKSLKMITFQLTEPEKEKEYQRGPERKKSKIRGGKHQDSSLTSCATLNKHKTLQLKDVLKENNSYKDFLSPLDLSKRGALDTQNSPLVVEKNLSESVEESPTKIEKLVRVGSEGQLIKRRVFKVKIFPLAWDDDEAIAIVLDDITHEKTITELKIADKNKDLVIAMVSHELRTPLNGMLGLLEIMKKEISQPDLLVYLNACKTSSLLLLNLVNSILDFSQIKNSKLKLLYSKVIISDLLSEIRSLFDHFCQLKNLSLNIEIDPNVPKMIITDQTRLSQIVINLLGNAFKFTFQGGVTIRISVAKYDPRQVQFSIIDTGIGIKKENQEKLFKLFGRLEQEDKKINTQGVGLGLTISNNLAILLNSREKTGIQVESEFGKGTVFSFSVRSEGKEKLEEKVGGLDKEDEDDEEQEANSYDIDDLDASVETVVERMATYSEMKEKFSACPPLRFKSGQMLPNLDSKALINLSSSEGLYRDSYTNLVGPSGEYSNKPGKKMLSECVTPKNFTIAAKKQFENPVIKEVSELPWCLIVDDNPFNLMVVINIMKDRGFQVKTALNGQEAVNAVQEHHNSGAVFKLILMDCQMPVMDGYEATRVLTGMMKKGEVEECPIVALTANNQDEEHEKLCNDAGMSGCVSKPLNIKELEDMLRRKMKLRDSSCKRY